MKIKLYKANIYHAFRADEQGIRWFTYVPADTIHYKHEVLDVIEKELPEGITYDDEYKAFDDRGHDCQLVYEKNNGKLYLVSSERIVEW